MNSSISNSEKKGFPTPIPILLGILLAFSLLELSMRVIFIPKSQDLRRFAEYPQKAKTLNSNGGPSFALIGNSATEEGVDPLLLQVLLRDAGMDGVAVDLFAADASGITTWNYMIKNIFIKTGRLPRYFIINYSGSLLLRDGNLEVGRLAQYFTKADDWKEVILNELPSTGQALQFGLSIASKTFAFSSRLKDRVLDFFIHDYKRFAQGNNQAMLNHERLMAAQKESSSEYTAPDYTRLERFLKMIRDSGASLIVVAFPMQPRVGKAPYEIDPQVRSLVEAYGFLFKDLREIKGLEANLYRDSIHLTREGKAVYTKILAGELIKIVHPIVIDRPL